MKKIPKTRYGPDNPHPLSTMCTELVWKGKYDEFGDKRDIDIAGRSFPLQRIETIDEPRSHAEATGDLFNPASAHRDDFRNRLIWGDNRLVMASLMSEFKGAIDLIYIDPPFHVGADFTLSAPIGDSRETIEKEQSIMEMVAYSDIWGQGMNSYISILYEQLTMMRDLLSERGSIYVHCDWRVNSAIRLCLNEIFDEGNFRNEIIWHYSKWTNAASHFQRNHDVILCYAKTDKTIFNPQYIETDYIRKVIDKGWRTQNVNGEKYILVYDKVKAAEEMKKDKYEKVVYVDNPGVLMPDVWTDINYLSSNSSERIGYPTQKPEALYERIIKASSKEDNLVADFFCGSGTMAAVAEKLGRKWIAADLGRFAIHTTQKRILSTQRKLHQEKEKYRSFDLFNLGRYERQWWQQESLKDADDEHRYIVLDFFRAEKLTHSTSHPLLHGRKENAFVHVDDIDSILTRDEVSEIAKAVLAAGGKKVHCLAWDFEMDLRQVANDIETEIGIKIHLHRIPREIMEKNRKAIPPFFEMSLIEAEPVIRKDKCVDIKLTKFIPNLTEVPSRELEQLQERAIENGFDFIDFWAIDFDWKKGKPFNHHWQDYRTLKDRSLKTVSDTNFSYDKSGKHIACIKVVDVFGCDTSITVEIKT